LVVSIVVLAGCAATPSKDARPGSLDVQYTTQFPDETRLRSVPTEVRVVSRATTGRSVAIQIGVNVLMLALGGGVGAQGFSKNDLKGEEIADVVDRSNINNPVSTSFVAELSQSVSESISGNAEWRSRVYGRPLYIGGGSAALVYDELFGEKEEFRLKLSLEVYKRKEAGGLSFSSPYQVVDCSTESEQHRPLSEWSGQDYVLVKQQLTASIEECREKVVAQLPRLLAN